MPPSRAPRGSAGDMPRQRPIGRLNWNSRRVCGSHRSLPGLFKLHPTFSLLRNFISLTKHSLLRHLYSQAHQLVSSMRERRVNKTALSHRPIVTFLYPPLPLPSLYSFPRWRGRPVSFRPSPLQYNNKLSSLEGETPSGTECGGCLPFNISFQKSSP